MRTWPVRRGFCQETEFLDGRGNAEPFEDERKHLVEYLRKELLSVKDSVGLVPDCTFSEGPARVGRPS